jgi:hypothetical protein
MAQGPMFLVRLDKDKITEIFRVTFPAIEAKVDANDDKADAKCVFDFRSKKHLHLQCPAARLVAIKIPASSKASQLLQDFPDDQATLFNEGMSIQRLYSLLETANKKKSLYFEPKFWRLQTSLPSIFVPHRPESKDGTSNDAKEVKGLHFLQLETNTISSTVDTNQNIYQIPGSQLAVVKPPDGPVWTIEKLLSLFSSSTLAERTKAALDHFHSFSAT